MNVADYLIDTSALVRVLLGRTTEEWDKRISAGLVAICDFTELEVLCSARSSAHRDEVKREINTHYAWCPLPDGVYRRARVVQDELTAKGEHRSAGPVDLLVAAVAEEAGLTLLHYDRDFETIARTTGQPTKMIDLRN
ncbi:PIN domain nuclease [Streptomyces sp. NBC_01619]|uniref:PIN domain nuclease n=1 Tax=unclassified Streptomyces TaxID=2593676 RepID=UPI00225653A4|nr:MULTISPECIES: PIN domain nuclease [unclassified Streptomyces]MCX4509168.1 PIN domain nuclease [Streptomyces sp. NBC_01619]